jgi:hypothetical protein
MFRLGLLALTGTLIVRQFVLYEKNCGCMDAWELNPEGVGSLWLMASTTWGQE